MRKKLSQKTAARFRRTVMRHYKTFGRDLPWRRPDATRDPYKIFVSEIMLQQTQVSRVLVKYERWLAEFPDFQKLARAPMRHVLKAWNGLGYNRRALLLKKTAEYVVNKDDGRFSSSIEELVKLPGIGPATAAAISAFAACSSIIFLKTKPMCATKKSCRSLNKRSTAQTRASGITRSWITARI